MTVNVFYTLIPMPGTILNVLHGLIISSLQPCEGESIILILEENPAVCSGNHPNQPQATLRTTAGSGYGGEIASLRIPQEENKAPLLRRLKVSAQPSLVIIVFYFQLHFYAFLCPLTPSFFRARCASHISLMLIHSPGVSLRLPSCRQMQMLPTMGSHCPIYTPPWVHLSSHSAITHLSDRQSLRAETGLFISISPGSGVTSGTGRKICTSPSTVSVDRRKQIIY